jgi:hypothetical protein
MKTHTHTQGPWHVGAGSGEGSIFSDNGRTRLLAALESLAVGLSPASVDMQRENLADLCRVCREIAENALAKVKGGEA